MHAIVKEKPPQALIDYLQAPLMQSIGFDPGRKMYHVGDCHVGGLLSKLQKLYYPHFQRKRRRQKKNTQKKGSSKAQGKAIDNQITKYIQCGKNPTHGHAKALLAYLKSVNLRPVAAQVPVYIKELKRVTQADLIVETPLKQLVMMEIKSGYNQMQAQGELLNLEGVKCNQNNIWELQRHYTHKGLVEGGLPLVGSHILQVYAEGKGGQVTVKKRKVPKWAVEKLK